MADPVLVGVHYFAGWWKPLPNKWTVAGLDWREVYPGRVPLLGEYNSQETMDKEIQAAASHGVDFFQILWYYNEPDSERAPNSRFLNRGVEHFCSSPNAEQMRFFIEFCNHPPFQVETDEQWAECIDSWLEAMDHPSYLRVGGKLVLKIHGGHYFINQNEGDLDRCRERLEYLRSAVRDAGLGEILIGCGVSAHESIGENSTYATLFDFTNTYMELPNCEFAEEPYPYTLLSEYIREGRKKHENDDIPYVPFLTAGWYPRPWKDPRPDFRFPSDAQWREELSRMKLDLESGESFGFPLPDGGRRKAFTIYAWNEFGEGGIVAPTVGEEYLKLEAIRDIFRGENRQGGPLMEQTRTYQERYRPQFHFTSRTNWLNDPNGCVYFDGQYHLFYQHNPKSVEWGNMTWGHAVSKDLVHWDQLPNAIFPYDGGTIFSGTAVVDKNNSAGFGENALVALFTHAREPFGQVLAYSTDRGWNWTLYDQGQRVVENQGLDVGERDPKVFWHKDKWVMVLWVKQNIARIFNSDDLKNWTAVSDFHGEGFYECPDLIQLPVDGENSSEKWVIYDAAFNYWIGDFNGEKFTAEAGPFRGDWGANFYAAQTWNNTGERKIQIAWMRGGSYPAMPFNQQMSFPCELSLRTTKDGIRLFRNPAEEIESLYGDDFELYDVALSPDKNPLEGIEGECFDIQIKADLQQGANLNLQVYNQRISCSSSRLSCLGATADFGPDPDVDLRVLVDRTSVEIFLNEGEISMSSCFLPEKDRTGIVLTSDGGEVSLKELKVYPLKGAWYEREEG